MGGRGEGEGDRGRQQSRRGGRAGSQRCRRRGPWRRPRRPPSAPPSLTPKARKAASSSRSLARRSSHAMRLAMADGASEKRGRCDGERRRQEFGGGIPFVTQRERIRGGRSRSNGWMRRLSRRLLLLLFLYY